MATKKTAVIPEEEILAAATDENIKEHSLHQTETEPEPDRVLSTERAPGDADLIDIIKTTSDGKKEGFAFRITGANGYDMTFTTDAKGEIFIEKLRIGEYTVTELKNSASEGYKIADPVKITLVANETLTVKIHNDKTKVDVPKTGDDANLMLWISLLGLAAAGAGCTAFFYLKKRRTGKHIAVKK